MFVVIFEVHPYPETFDTYLALARELRPLLDDIAGFLSIERFASVQRPGWVVSLSFWRDEAALVQWRTVERHHDVQVQGRANVFANYRLRVSQVILDLQEGTLAQPDRRSAYNDVTAHPPAFVTILEIDATPDSAKMIAQAALANGFPGLVSMERFESIYTPGKQLVLTAWQDEQTAQTWHHHIMPYLQTVQGGYRWRMTEVERDYGMFVRQAAPQYYPPIAPKTVGNTRSKAE